MFRMLRGLGIAIALGAALTGGALAAEVIHQFVATHFQ